VFVAFEGIDGSGKTTLSNLVVERLRAGGGDVLHAQEKGVLASAVARRVRDLTRDATLLEMSPRAELFLNLAREAQQLDQIVRPALAAGKLVVADRSLHTLVALAAAGRALPRAEVEAAVRVGAGGLRPDVVVLVDVDPDLARLRKRVGKILDGRDREAESRKGLAGAGLQVRIRRHLQAEAAADPARWIVAVNEGRLLAALAEDVAAEILRRRSGAPPAAARPPALNVAVDPELLLDPSPGRVAARFRAAVQRLADTEPALAAYLLAGIPGAAEHALRAALAPRAPRLVARSLRGLRDADADALRRALAAGVPEDVAVGLDADASPAAMALRAELLAAAPGAAVAGLAGNDGAEAWALRRRAVERGALDAALEGLAGVAAPAAWALRAEGMRRELWGAVGKSLGRVAGREADALRAALAERDPVAAIRATEGLDGEAVRALRERFFVHAPKRVLRALAGVDAPYAWALRLRALGDTKEALDSVDGMDQPPAWELREAGVPAWPATAVSSLRALAPSARGRAVVARALRAAPGSIAVLRNAHAAFARAEAGLTDPAPAVVTRPGPAAPSPPRPLEETCSI
jgi:dTMP kinase